MFLVSHSSILKLGLSRGIGLSAQIFMQFLVTRVAGPAGIAMLQLYQTWTCILGETCALGQPTVVMKQISQRPQADTLLLNIRQAISTLLVIWAAVVLLAAFILSINPWASVTNLPLILMVSWSVLCFALLRVSAEALKALGHAEKAVYIENSCLLYTSPSPRDA